MAMLHKKLPHLIYFALPTNYFNVFMSTTVLLGLTSFEKNWGPVDFWGASDFSNLLAPWASGSRSLMLRAEFKPKKVFHSITMLQCQCSQRGSCHAITMFIERQLPCYYYVHREAVAMLLLCS